MSYFAEGFLVIGQYISANLVAQVIISLLREQMDIHNCSSCLMQRAHTHTYTHIQIQTNKQKNPSRI